ncbi:Fic family protein, partial [Microgenomates group bacterium]|nr:Fic family protein [Microgenomates group bacterium]
VDVKNNRDYLRYTGPTANKVLKLINELLIWLNRQGKKLHPVLAVGIFHYEFVSIHPFTDGNGRVTRLLTLLFLRLNHYGFRDVLIPDTFYLQFRRQYYQALSQAKIYNRQRLADLTPWLDYFTWGLLVVAEELKKNITLVSLKKKSEKPIELSSAEIALLDFCKTMGKLDLQTAIDILEIPRRTAQRRLKILVDKGLLARKGKGKNIYYVC